ncbi:MAG: M20/M25/M40 family metallo-hydrolase, partial [Vicinamibacterales bacterium]
RNALIELAHQLLQTNDLSDPARGVKFNWTIGSGGNTRNVIPEAASRALATKAQAIYGELGKHLTVDEKSTGAGTDGAFAALSGRPVLESLGLRGFGFHSSNEEYIQLDSIESRLYLLSRLVAELSRTQ